VFCDGVPDKARIIRRHCELIEAHLPPRLALLQLKKHLAWYSAGLPGAARVREILFRGTDVVTVHETFWRLWDSASP
jgi:tRNA-dihydrouridine synthase